MSWFSVKWKLVVQAKRVEKGILQDSRGILPRRFIALVPIPEG